MEKHWHCSKCGVSLTDDEQYYPRSSKVCCRNRFVLPWDSKTDTGHYIPTEEEVYKYYHTGLSAWEAELYQLKKKLNVATSCLSYIEMAGRSETSSNALSSLMQKAASEALKTIADIDGGRVKDNGETLVL